MKGFASTLVQRRIVINALRVSLVVGTLLNAINQGGQFLSGLEIAWGQVLLNFMVPYCVASYSAAKNETERNINEI
ncbi:nitrate/nitrite transporter NrtS [Dasania marina]|uniref:nitrate/nitrite transporter NrtS n=1 Tax=Dasania marina TaxID=471499 RepID=UPI00037D5A43|nr:nitrate/nitrite transporter NrtS [Dasania marina]